MYKAYGGGRGGYGGGGDADGWGGLFVAILRLGNSVGGGKGLGLGRGEEEGENCRLYHRLPNGLGALNFKQVHLHYFDARFFFLSKEAKYAKYQSFNNFEKKPKRGFNGW